MYSLGDLSVTINKQDRKTDDTYRKYHVRRFNTCHCTVHCGLNKRILREEGTFLHVCDKVYLYSFNKEQENKENKKKFDDIENEKENEAGLREI